MNNIVCILTQHFVYRSLPAKNEEMKAKIVVRKIVAPIVEYLITSKLGQRNIISLLTPEQNKKKLEIELSFDIFKFNLNI